MSLKSVPQSPAPDPSSETVRKPGVLAALVATLSTGGSATGNAETPGVRMIAPVGTITPTGPWSLGSRAGDYLFVAGMRGIDPKTNTLVEGDTARVRQAFLNMKMIAEFDGARLADCVRLVVYVTDMARLRPIANAVQEQLWGGAGYPPRTIVEVQRLNEDDIFEVEGTFYVPKAK
jgi:2-iminobutanoate/2-iminopropanoate deaminase